MVKWMHHSNPQKRTRQVAKPQQWGQITQVRGGNVTDLFGPEKVWDKVWLHGSPAAGHIALAMMMAMAMAAGRGE